MTRNVEDMFSARKVISGRTLRGIVQTAVSGYVTKGMVLCFLLDYQRKL